MTKAAFGLGSALMLLTLTGCHSAYIAATVINATGADVRVVEVDYPSASFGKPGLAAGAQFQYRFKVLGSGPTKVIWTDAERKEHTVAGPSLAEGNEGRLTLTLQGDTATWQLELKR